VSEGPPRIEEIEDRLQDLTDALREAGADDVADQLEDHARHFTDKNLVRRAVNDIRMQLERWREFPEESLDTAKINLASNRLEDVCIEALDGGIIEPAALSVSAQARRKLGIVFGTFLAVAAALLVPILLIEAGVDFSDVDAERELPPLAIPRGEERQVEVTVLAEALVPHAAHGVELAPRDGCRDAAPGASCRPTQQRLWPSGRLDTFELRLENQAYGLLFAFGESRVRGGVGEVQVLLAATNDTPEGRYRIPLTAAYLGYTPQRCELTDRLLGSCPKPRTGEGERHGGLPVPVIVVDVMPGDAASASGDRRVAQAEEAERRERARERAEQLAAAIDEIDAAIKETGRLIRRRKWDDVRERLDKLARLFEPIDAISLTEVAEELPVEVSEVRARYGELRERLQRFEQQVFERTFDTLTAEKNQKVAEEKLVGRVARKFRISPAYVQDIYTERTDEIQRRMAERERAKKEALQAAQEALEQRCGPLPGGAWGAVKKYLEELNAGVEVELGECMTPRLTQEHCWEMRCDYVRRVELSVEQPKVVTRHRATFYLQRGRVTAHHGG
jgi:hypothetical protein